jgi:hypothetical protein
MVVLKAPLLAANEKNSKASQETSPPATTQTRELPDAPKPKLQEPSDGNQERVDETRIWWRDVDYPRRPWSHAFGDLKFLVPAAALAGLTAVQIRRTDQCLAAHKGFCNMFFGNKSRAALYAINIPLTSALLFSSAKLAEHNKTNAAIFIMTVGFIYEVPAVLTANRRTPACKTGECLNASNGLSSRP